MPNDLESILKAKPDGEALAIRLGLIKDSAEPLLSYIVKTFPEYTPHDICHSKEVLRCLNDFIDDTLKEAFNAYEIYFLMASVYLHDIGMADFPELRIGVDKERLKENIRDKHHFRSKEFIEKNYEKLNIEDPHQAKIIGEICLGHRREDLSDETLFNPNWYYKGYSINIPLLAAFLRIADELDLTFERTPRAIYDHFPPENLESIDEWKKSLEISGVGLSNDDPLRIVATAVCSNAAIHRKLKELELKVNKELDQLPYLLYQHKDYYIYLPRKFSIYIQSKGYRGYDVKFTLNDNKIIDLLLGELIYGNKFDALRELIKNSIDACKQRACKFIKEDATFNPKIEIEYMPEDSILIIDDNGVGMSDYIVSNFLAKLGQSFYKSSEFKEGSFEFLPLSELGYGFLSCFMIAKKVIIETKAENCDPISITINDVHDYFDIKSGERKKIGTRITLFLKEDVKNFDAETTIKHYIRHVNISISLKLKEKVIPIESMPFIRVNIECFQKRGDFDFMRDNLKEFVIETIELNDDTLEGTLNILLIKNEKLVPIPIGFEWMDLEYPNTVFSISVMRDELPSLCYEGIFVRHLQDTNLLNWLERNYVAIDLNLKKDLLDFRFSRDSIIENERYFDFKNHLDAIIIKAFEKYLGDLSEKVADYKKLYKDFLDNYIYISGVHLLTESEVENVFSPSFLEFIKKYYYFEIFTKDGFDLFNYQEVKKYKNCIIIKSRSNEDNDEIARKLLSSSKFCNESIYIKLGRSHNIVYHFHRYLFNSDPIYLESIQ
jgi:hypothetical protein